MSIDSDGALFVYGSLLDAAHRAALLGREVAAAPARMAGYERRRGPAMLGLPAHAGIARA